MSNKIFKRNAYGLIEGFKYAYTDDGRIDWKKHIPAKYLQVKHDKKADVIKRYGKELNEIDLTTIEDYYLYVTLGGYNELAVLRGYKELIQHVDHVSENKAVCTCKISFLPNFENIEGLTCSGVAGASFYNVGKDYASFLETIAENRAFSRCVRRALNINIVSQEELTTGETVKIDFDNAKSANVPEEKLKASGNSPQDVLAALCSKKSITIQKLVVSASSIKSELTGDPAEWSSFSDIGDLDAYTLMNRIKEGKK